MFPVGHRSMKLEPDIVFSWGQKKTHLYLGLRSSGLKEGLVLQNNKLWICPMRSRMLLTPLLVGNGKRDEITSKWISLGSQDLFIYSIPCSKKNQPYLSYSLQITQKLFSEKPWIWEKKNTFSFATDLYITENSSLTGSKMGATSFLSSSTQADKTARWSWLSSTERLYPVSGRVNYTYNLSHSRL